MSFFKCNVCQRQTPQKVKTSYVSPTWHSLPLQTLPTTPTSLIAYKHILHFHALCIKKLKEKENTKPVEFVKYLSSSFWNSEQFVATSVVWTPSSLHFKGTSSAENELHPPYMSNEIALYDEFNDVAFLNELKETYPTCVLICPPYSGSGVLSDSCHLSNLQSSVPTFCFMIMSIVIS
ncbi:hypothetical protein LXL04_028531 [Taraxacum kok-saghyz]